MKKSVFFIIVIMLCFVFLFCGCSKVIKVDQTQNISNADIQDTTNLNTQGEFCRVMCLQDNGIVVWTGSFGYIFVKAVDAALEIVPLQTVVIEFLESDLEPTSGKFTDAFGNEMSYSFVLRNMKSIRHTTTEEPTFG